MIYIYIYVYIVYILSLTKRNLKNYSGGGKLVAQFSGRPQSHAKTGRKLPPLNLKTIHGLFVYKYIFSLFTNFFFFFWWEKRKIKHTVLWKERRTPGNREVAGGGAAAVRGWCCFP